VFSKAGVEYPSQDAFLETFEQFLLSCNKVKINSSLHTSFVSSSVNATQCSGYVTLKGLFPDKLKM
jgi:hypothetical protein